MNQHELLDCLWLVTVIEQQSFSAAAEKLGVSKSVISKHISRLEKKLGVQLLKRTTRKLVLTEIGEQVYRQALELSEQLDRVKQLASMHRDEPKGRLRINAPFGFGQRHLVPIAAAFMKRYPSIQIELILGSYLSTLIHDGFDLVIYLKKPPQENIVIREFMSHRMHLCASPKYLKKQGTPKTPEELLKHNCLVYKSLDHTRPWHFIDKTGKKFEVMIRGNFSANSSQALLNAALNDVGIIKLSSHIVNAYLEKGKLVSLLDSYCEKNICIYMARSQSSFVPKKLRLFMDYLLNYFSTGNSAIL